MPKNDHDANSVALQVVADITSRDGVKAEASKDELLSSLWTYLGGNRSSMSRLNKQLALLNNVNGYRRVAWAHVQTTIMKLQAIRAQLEDLRERVGSPETVGTDKVPLEVHIDSINLGIERLEEQRDASRQAIQRGYQDTINRAEAANERMIGGGEL